MASSNPLLWLKPSGIWRYGIGILSILFAVVICHSPAFHLQSAPVSLFLSAIIVSAWLGGTGPAILAAAVSIPAFYYYILPPIHSFASKPEDLPRFLIFSVSAVFVGSMCAAQRRVTESLWRTRDELVETVHQLQRSNEFLEAGSRERKQAEEGLRRSEAYLTEAQRLSHTGSFGWRISTGEIFWSDETFRIFQYDRTTVPNVERILERVHPDDVASVKEAMERASQDGHDFEHEYRLVVPDGGVKHVHVVAHAERNQSGEIEFVGAVMDVSDRKRAEQELRESEALAEQHFRLVVDTTPAMINTCRPDGYLDYVNKGWLDYFGLSLETALDRADIMKMSAPSTGAGSGGSWQPIVHPEDLVRFRDHWKATLASGKPGECEGRVRRFDGQYRWHLFRGVPLCDEKGRPVKWYISAFDIEDRKRAEEALRRSEAYLAEAQRLTNIGSWARNVLTGHLVHSSEELSCLYGLDPDRRAPSFEDFVQRVHPDDRVRVIQTYESAIRAKKDFDTHFRVVLPGGTAKYMYGTGHPVFDPSGDVSEFVGIVMDVTERRRAEEERERLRQTQAELARINRVTTMGELTASLAHEINQPITAAVTNANTCVLWLTRDSPDIEEARAAAERIVKDGKRAAEIIKRIRRLFKKGTPERVPVDANEIVREMIPLLRSEAMQYSISFRTSLASDLPHVMADRVQLQQVLMNLILNGIDAVKGVDGAREVTINSQTADNQHILLSVSDTGVGLPSQGLSQIFDPFFSTKPDGSGMGLAISRSIVESHGGHLWAAGNTPRGASFYFTMPVDTPRLE